MTPGRWLNLALGVALSIALAMMAHYARDRDALRDAVATAAMVRDAKGRPASLNTKGAIQQIRVLGQAVADARQARANAAAADARHALTVERRDTEISQGVSKDVQARIDRVQAELDASRALAARRLRELAQARADQGGGGTAREPETADATCIAAFAAGCDDVLALLAAAERQTAQLVGWQRWWAEISAARAADDEGREGADHPVDMRD